MQVLAQKDTNPVRDAAVNVYNKCQKQNKEQKQMGSGGIS